MAFVDNPFLLLLLLSLSPISIDSRIGNSTDVPLENVVIPHWDQNSFDKYFERIEINRNCDINENCTHNMLCIDNRCRCRPNHKWNRLEKSCVSFDCKTNETECQLYDPHRECRHISLSISGLFGGQCECTHGYYEDKRNMKCRKLCHNNAECDPGIARGGVTNNLVCVDALCQCRPNFKWDVVSNRCQAFNCTKDAECWTDDENRECVDGMDSKLVLIDFCSSKFS